VLPAAFALGAGARFVARSIDTMAKHLGPVFEAAHAHRGTSFVEILQNCPVFNDGTWDHVTENAVASDSQIFLEHARPMLFGAEMNKGLRLRPNSLELEIVTLGVDGVSESDILVHDQTNQAMAYLVAQLEPPRFPLALGVLFCDPAPTYDSEVRGQLEDAQKNGPGDLDKLLRSGHTWTVE
jgi:2-oxoglutarate ferredoxin oxidoreductase subunit beta